MPELPEVETIVRDLRRLVTGSTISDVEVLKADLLGGDPDAFISGVRGRAIISVGRRAKNIIVDLQEARLVINLGMTGRVLVAEKGASEPSHLGVRFSLADGRRMLYQDVRRFGRLDLLDPEAWRVRETAFGIEPLSEDFTTGALHSMARQSRVAIKPWLMDQARVVGVGNIYASEALFRAGIDPRKAANRLTKPKAAALTDAVRMVLQEAIDFRGTTLLDYRDASGESGEFSKRLQVYGREGEPCVTCSTPIRRIVQGGRSTFFCAHCQKR